MFPLESRKFPVSLPVFVLHEEELFHVFWVDAILEWSNGEIDLGRVWEK